MDAQKNFTKNRRIAFVCFSPSLGGLELSLGTIASEFNERSADCIVIVPPDSKLEHYVKQMHLPCYTIEPHCTYGDILSSIKLARILREHRIDLVILMQSRDFSIVTIAHLFVPSVKLAFYQEMQFRHNKRDVFHTWMYSRLSLWMTLTHAMKRDVLEFTRVSENRITVIPLGTDIHRFSPDAYEKFASRKQFGIPESKTVIGVLGRLDPQKGQEELLRAVPMILQNHKNIHVVLAGDATHGHPAYKEQLERLVHELDIQSVVQFLPFTHQVPAFLSALDIFILPSHSETFGFVLIEAMAMKLAIVATNAGGVPEIITDGSTGILIPPRDTQSIAGAVIRLLQDSEFRNSLSYRAFKEARDRFSLTKSIDQLVSSLDVL